MILDTLMEYIFSVIKKHVKNKLLRGTLYVLTWLVILAALLIPIFLGYTVIVWVLEGISNLIG